MVSLRLGEVQQAFIKHIRYASPAHAGCLGHVHCMEDFFPPPGKQTGKIHCADNSLKLFQKMGRVSAVTEETRTF